VVGAWEGELDRATAQRVLSGAVVVDITAPEAAAMPVG
jgi:hypothetical protein